MLYLIGLGLGAKEDITLRGFAAVKQSATVYLEHYTSIQPQFILEDWNAFFGKSILLASRELVESGSEIIDRARQEDVAFLVIGDVFGATTHTDLYLRAVKAGVRVEVINNASILNAVGNTGLELYRFGKTTSLPFWTSSFKPMTTYDVVKENMQRGLHTLILLDIKVSEPSEENLRKGVSIPEPPRFMNVPEAIDLLFEMEASRKEAVLAPETRGVALSRIGSPDQLITSGTLAQLRTVQLGEPLHSLVIPGNLHHIEEEMLSLWKL
ncbi:MAG: diphthine synthase [Candidatus Woesearchaeota archaeon]|nr:MAG: diphthine synthase [Candidatus Woesearchaeota archaeon]